jgi:competence protein ComEA
MFGRRHSPDVDAVALARRRLAALATQLDNDDPDEGNGVRRVPHSDAEELGLSGAGATVDGRTGRHAAARPSTAGLGRWDLSPQHIAVLALLLACVLAVAAWVVLRSQPHATPVHLTNERTIPSTAAPALPGATASPVPPTTVGTLAPAAAPQSGTGLLVVDVTGRVRRPGIVELPPGSRVFDALRAAGGARPGVPTRALNLARPLVDGEQIVVGVKVPPVDLVPSPVTSAGTTPGAITSVNLNTATQSELEALPGIGPVTAAAILQWRTENGAFTSIDQLLDVSGIGDVTFANLKAFVHV